MITGQMKGEMEKFVKAMADTLNTPEQTVDVAKKVEAFKAIATDEKALEDYAKSVADTVIPLLPVQSTVRSIFQTDPMPGNVRQVGYPINFKRTQVATVLPNIGAVPEIRLEGDEIFVPPINLGAQVAFPMKYARDGRFNMGELATTELKNQIIWQEEYCGWQTIKATITGVLGAQTIGTGPGAFVTGSPNLFAGLTLSGLNRALTQLDTYERKLTDLYMSPKRFGDIRDWTTVAIDYFTQREIYKNAGPADARVYDVMLHKVYDTNFLGNGEVFGFDTRTFGKMPIVQELETFSDPVAFKKREIGIWGYEEVGFGAMDSWGIVRLRLENF